ncbi:MAG: hypothetical protein R6W70_00805 [bacterium]
MKRMNKTFFIFFLSFLLLFSAGCHRTISLSDSMSASEGEYSVNDTESFSDEDVVSSGNDDASEESAEDGHPNDDYDEDGDTGDYGNTGNTGDIGDTGNTGNTGDTAQDDKNDEESVALLPEDFNLEDCGCEESSDFQPVCCNDIVNVYNTCYANCLYHASLSEPALCYDYEPGLCGKEDTSEDDSDSSSENTKVGENCNCEPADSVFYCCSENSFVYHSKCMAVCGCEGTYSACELTSEDLSGN